MNFSRKKRKRIDFDILFQPTSKALGRFSVLEIPSYFYGSQNYLVDCQGIICKYDEFTSELTVHQLSYVVRSKVNQITGSSSGKEGEDSNRRSYSPNRLNLA